jgi:hypothetical protein
VPGEPSSFISRQSSQAAKQGVRADNVVAAKPQLKGPSPDGLRVLSGQVRERIACAVLSFRGVNSPQVRWPEIETNCDSDHIFFSNSTVLSMVATCKEPPSIEPNYASGSMSNEDEQTQSDLGHRQSTAASGSGTGSGHRIDHGNRLGMPARIRPLWREKPTLLSAVVTPT